MSYFPWIAGGAALGYAARRRGRFGRPASPPPVWDCMAIVRPVRDALTRLGFQTECYGCPADSYPKRDECYEGSSVYLTVLGDVFRDGRMEDFGDKIRISDHWQPRGGGFNAGTRERYGETPWSIDPTTFGRPVGKSFQARLNEILEDVQYEYELAQENA